MDGLDIRTAPFSYYKDSTFFIDNKGRTAINPNIFIYVLDGIIRLFTGGGVRSMGKLMCKKQY